LPAKILFLSDIQQELEAAKEAGFQTLQLVRPGTEISWNDYVHDFSEINSKLGL
jgi:enolase-phosphatase E1